MVTKKKEKTGAGTEGGEGEGGSHSQYQSPHRFDTQVLESYFFTCDGFGLLLKRRSKHNDKTWDLPGGQADPADRDLAGTALREAGEELGHVPEPFKLVASVPLSRGKHGQKHYTVYVAEVAADTLQAYKPDLATDEHSDWHWFKLDGLAQLHDYQASHGMETESEAGPALKPGSGDDDDDEIKKKEHHKHHKHHKDESEDGQQYIKDGVVMHPWVFLLFEHCDQWYPKLGPSSKGTGCTSTAVLAQGPTEAAGLRKPVGGSIGKKHVKVQGEDLRSGNKEAAKQGYSGSNCSVS